MNNTILLIGSLSNDLLRAANLSQRGSIQGAERFLSEAKKWALSLSKAPLPSYITQIVGDIVDADEKDTSMASAEKYLMYSILLQNFTLHSKSK